MSDNDFTDEETDEVLEALGMVSITPVRVIRDEGTLVLFSGLTEENQECTFAVEHRMAQYIIDAMETGLEPVCSVPPYLMLS